MIFTNAEEVINHLYSLPHLHPKSDLSYIKRILHVLHNPQDQVKTIHVTGTNGKGSTSYYLSNLLQKAGQKTGLFVSPYIREFNERMQINGQDISNQDLVHVANQIEVAIHKLQEKEADFNLVTFEYEVAMAFLFFAQKGCRYAVIEVGIGGAHDKTNVIKPEVSVITTIGLDHEKIIGPTLADIAHEKSGIIKSKRPVVLGNIPKSVLQIILAKAQKESAAVYLLGKDFQVNNVNKDCSYNFNGQTLSFRRRPLVESYDIAVAVTAFKLLHFSLSDHTIEKAINDTQIPGRYQIISTKPKIILDGAHNIQAMKNLLAIVEPAVKGQLYVLIMMMKDKDLKQVFALFDKSDQLTLTTIPYYRAAKKKDFPTEVVEAYPYQADYLKAYQQLKNALKPNDVLLVTGSFYLVGAILNLEEDHES